MRAPLRVRVRVRVRAVRRSRGRGRGRDEGRRRRRRRRKRRGGRRGGREGKEKREGSTGRVSQDQRRGNRRSQKGWSVTLVFVDSMFLGRQSLSYIHCKEQLSQQHSQTTLLVPLSSALMESKYEYECGNMSWWSAIPQNNTFIPVLRMHLRYRCNPESPGI